ncbi:hypothetical protein [Burkholderia ubonensis]|uniref:hypothetical protein n=1 Tax=Burkholderia ubonensis TaxID=101571 RepID=UPI000AE8941A|nr:hypothetical protein [Burkholderia ubonensis]
MREYIEFAIVSAAMIGVTKAYEFTVGGAPSALASSAYGLQEFIDTVDSTWAAVEGYSRSALQDMYEEIPKLYQAVAEMESLAAESWAMAEEKAADASDANFWAKAGEDLERFFPTTKGIPKYRLLKEHAWEFSPFFSMAAFLQYGKSIVGKPGGMVTPETVPRQAANARYQLDTLQRVLRGILYPASDWNHYISMVAHSALRK